MQITPSKCGECLSSYGEVGWGRPLSVPLSAWGVVRLSIFPLCH